MKNVRWEHIPLFVLQVLMNVATVGVALLLNALIDAAQASIITGDSRFLRDILIVSAIYAVCLGALVFLFNRYKASYIRKRLLAMRNRLAHGTLQTGIAAYEETGSAAYVTAFNQNFPTIEEKVIQNRISIMDSIICIVVAVLVLIYMNPLIAVISIAAMAIPSLLPRLFTRALEKAQTSIIESTNSYNETVNDLLGGYEVIKTYHAEKELLPQFTASASSLEGGKEHLSSLMAMVYGLTTFSSVAVQFAIMGLAGFFAVKGYITIGSIVAVTQLTGQVISPAFELSAKISELKAAQPVLDTLEALSSPAALDAQAVRPLKHCIALQDVTFRYADRSILDKVSARFEKGKKYAIIGKSGSGKSTLLKLIAGYYPQAEGTIRTDGSTALPDSIAMIHQNTFLFNDSVRNNLTLWKSYAEDEILEAVRRVGLTELVATLPQGLDTMVEENGANFSGGECQRLAIARALLSGKDILLLDEATSALDERTAREVEDSILSLDDVTCISVTHRLAPETARNYEAVLTMDAGQLR